MSCVGQEFRPGAMVCMHKPSDNEYPVFGEIKHIIIVDDVKYLAVELDSSEFCFHFAYKVCSILSFQTVPITKLVIHQVYHIVFPFITLLLSDHVIILNF